MRSVAVEVDLTQVFSAVNLNIDLDAAEICVHKVPIALFEKIVQLKVIRKKAYQMQNTIRR